MQQALKWFVVLFGVVCAVIGMTHILYGPSSIPGSIPVNATMDSEDRFYAALFVGFGLTLVWCAMDLAARRGAFFWLLIVFFASGLSRLVSIAQVGFPHPLFTFLTGVELALPVALWLWHRRAYATGR
jgi:hypothetical protein